MFGLSSSTSLIFENPQVLVAFGLGGISSAAIETQFSDLKFSYLRQNHGVGISEIKTSAEIISNIASQTQTICADAQVTNLSHVALAIRTADCLPILIQAPKLNSVIAIHAGWRGVAQNIVAHSLSALIENTKFSIEDLNDCLVWIGPHIRHTSFKVGSDVADQILTWPRRAQIESLRKCSNAIPADRAQGRNSLQEKNDSKVYIDLESEVRNQLAEFGISKLTTLNLDTFTSNSFESFRRDRERASRQISFIALK
jgi:polyphenol oxidase